jgi:putative iron-dependent peroxidase
MEEVVIDEGLVVGIGSPLASALKLEIPGFRPFPALSGAKIAVPSTQHALWCWLKGSDLGELVHRSRALLARLAAVLEVEDVLDTFRYADSRDLSGYVDGTENPKGKKATAAALVAGQGAAFDGGSFVAVQTWLHDLDQFLSRTESERDLTFGRRHRDNQEFDQAPPSAHVKRAAQESFEPEAFMVRRSMPWTNGKQSGLQFVAFGASLDRYEMVLRRMLGLDDGIVDALFNFSRPLTGGYYFCPPQDRGGLRFASTKWR